MAALQPIPREPNTIHDRRAISMYRISTKASPANAGYGYAAGHRASSKSRLTSGSRVSGRR